MTITAVSLVVAAVPESLPAVVTPGPGPGRPPDGPVAGHPEAAARGRDARRGHRDRRRQDRHAHQNRMSVQRAVTADGSTSRYPAAATNRGRGPASARRRRPRPACAGRPGLHRWLPVAVATSALLQVAGVLIEPLRALLGTQPLTAAELLSCAAVAVLPGLMTGLWSRRKGFLGPGDRPANRGESKPERDGTRRNNDHHRPEPRGPPRAGRGPGLHAYQDRRPRTRRAPHLDRVRLPLGVPGQDLRPRLQHP
ncbi:cation transporting ATPase C-terminal domain-containing protein [Paractinoplanes rishiriensis]|uniref:cation transporting ATPase C-terminal domain-containing protein n=1 Tax=Paractinoplanes rishiriensis TaxID=1050105 RepID=UPI0034DB609E